MPGRSCSFVSGLHDTYSLLDPQSQDWRQHNKRGVRVWRRTHDYTTGDDPTVKADSVESAIRRANETIPRHSRAHMILAVKADVPQGWVSLGAITCGCERWCHGAQNTSAKDVVTSFRKDTERHDAGRRRSLKNRTL
jgi:hypothetical protein